MGIGRLSILLVASALFAATQTGCSNSLPVPTSRAPSQDPAQVQAVSALHLMLPQTSQEDDEQLLELVATLNSLNPSVEISASVSSDYEADLADAIFSDSPPDLFLAPGSRLPELVLDGLVAPIPDSWIDSSQLLRPAASGITVQDEVYCFPHSIHTVALLYNVDLFEGAGLATPTSDWDWDDLAAAAEALTSEEQDRYGLALDPNPATWILFYFQAGGEVDVDSQGRLQLAQSPAQSASEFFARLFHEGIAITPATLNTAWAGEAFARGNVAMTIAGDWIVPYLSSEPTGFRYASAELPKGPAGKSTIAFTNCLAVHAKSPNRDLALQLAAQLTAPEVLPTWTGGSGVGLSVYNDQDVVWLEDRPEFGSYLRSLRYAQPWRLGSFAQINNDSFAEGINRVLADELAPQDYWSYVQREGRFTSPQ